MSTGAVSWGSLSVFSSQPTATQMKMSLKDALEVAATTSPVIMLCMLDPMQLPPLACSRHVAADGDAFRQHDAMFHFAQCLTHRQCNTLGHRLHCLLACLRRLMLANTDMKRMSCSNDKGERSACWRTAFVCTLANTLQRESAGPSCRRLLLQGMR